MILSHRNRHVYMMLLLAVLLPVVFIAGLIWRPRTPTVDDSTQDLFAAANFPTESLNQPVGTTTLLVRDVEVTAELLQSSQGNSMLRLQPSEALPFANAVVYWLPSEAPTETLGPDAILLGQLSGTHPRQFVLPDPSGQLLFYSLGQKMAIASVPLSF